MARARLYMLLQDAEGNLQMGAQVRILQPHTTNPIMVPMYEADEGEDTIPNPFIAEFGVISIYVADPIRVRIAFQVEGSAEQFIEDIDIGGATTAEASDHPGLGSDSVRVGSGSSSEGDNSVAVGVNSLASSNHSTALGTGSRATQNGATALGRLAEANANQAVSIGREAETEATGAIGIGYQTNVSQNFGVALGYQAVVSGTQGAAIGRGATATHDNSVAIGTNVSTTDENQIVLGGGDHSTYIPGTAVFRSPDATFFEIRVTEFGTLYTAWSVPSSEENILPAADSEFSGGVGGWTSPNATLSITNDSALSPLPLLTMEDADHNNFMRSSSIGINEESNFIVQAWMRATSGDMGVFLRIVFLDENEAFMEFSPPLLIPRAPNQWVKLSSRGITPVGAEYAYLHIQSWEGTDSDQIYIESASLFEI